MFKSVFNQQLMYNEGHLINEFFKGNKFLQSINENLARLIKKLRALKKRLKPIHDQKPAYRYATLIISNKK